MRLVCPITYTIRGSTKSNARFSRYCFRETVEVDIEDVSTFEAPVAVVWTPSPEAKQATEWGRDVSGPDGTQLTRWHEGAHWLRLCDGHFYGQRRLGPTISVEGLRSMLESAQRSFSARIAINLHKPPGADGKATVRETGGDPRPKFDVIRFDGRELALDDLRKAAGDLISVNGALHRKCSEPFIAVEVAVEDGNVVARELAVETRRETVFHASTSINAYFGINRWEEAFAFADSLPTSKKGPPIVPSPPTVLMDQSLTYDWKISFRAAMEAREMQKSLSMSRIAIAALDQVILSASADEQYEIMQTIDIDQLRQVGNGAALRNYAKLMEILEDRPISLGVTGASPQP